jgi:hypothetical protein
MYSKNVLQILEKLLNMIARYDCFPNIGTILKLEYLFLSSRYILDMFVNSFGFSGSFNYST